MFEPSVFVDLKRRLSGEAEPTEEDFERASILLAASNSPSSLHSPSTSNSATPLSTTPTFETKPKTKPSGFKTSSFVPSALNNNLPDEPDDEDVDGEEVDVDGEDVLGITSVDLGNDVDGAAMVDDVDGVEVMDVEDDAGETMDLADSGDDMF